MLNDQKKRVAIHTPLRMRVIIIKTMKSKNMISWKMAKLKWREEN